MRVGVQFECASGKCMIARLETHRMPKAHPLGHAKKYRLCPVGVLAPWQACFKDLPVF